MSSPYVHDLSPYIFQVKNINFSWVPTWWGISFLVLFFGGGFFLSRFLNKKYPAKSQNENESGPYAWIDMVLFFLLFVFVALFGMHKFNINWGLLWYSTAYLAGYIQVYIVLSILIKQKKVMLTAPLLDSLILYIFFGMVIGARTVYVFVYNWSEYSANLGDIFKVWQGGLSFHGGILGVLIATILYTRKHKIPFYHIADALCLVTPFGIGLGRIGNFMNGELWGRIAPENLPWAVIFPRSDAFPRHPSQIYQSFFEGWLLIPILYFVYKKKWAEGSIAITFIFFYGFNRFLMEFFREADSQLSYYFDHTLTMGQILCICTMLFAGVLYYFNKKSHQRWSDSWLKNIEEFQVKNSGLK